MCVEMSYDQPKTIHKRFTLSCLSLENNQIQYGRHHSEGTKSGPIDLQTDSLLFTKFTSSQDNLVLLDFSISTGTGKFVPKFNILNENDNYFSVPQGIIMTPVTSLSLTSL